MMRKVFVGLLVGAVAVGLAAPAFAADLKFTGGYRFRFQFDENMGCMTDQPIDPTGADPAVADCSGHEFQARFAPRFDVETEGGVRGVIRLEIGDLRYGNIATVGKSAVGGAGNDGVNVETKWAYFDFPVPATPLRLRLGLQPISISKELFFGDDFPAVSLYGKLGETNVNAFWIRGNDKVGVDDTGKDARDIFGLDLGFSPMKDLSLNAYLVYDHDMENTILLDEASTGFWVGAAAAGKVQNIRWDLDLVYGTKEILDAAGAEVDQSGWMVDGGVGMALAGTPLDLEVRGWYATGRDSPTGDNDAFPVLIGPDHESGMMSVWGGGDPVDIDNVLADNPQNTWGIGLVARWTVSPALKLTANVHYIGTVEEGTSTFASPAGDGRIGGVDSIGTDVGVRVDYTIYKGLVLTVVAGHLFLGDDIPIAPFTPTGASNTVTQFEDVSKFAAVLNYAF